MKLIAQLFLFIILGVLLSIDNKGYAGEQNPGAYIDTGKGTIIVELYPRKAPETVKNFIAYAKDGFYDGTIFHRVIENFMIQGGGFTSDMQQKKPTYPPIKNESKNELGNERGTIAMARTNDPHSATSQFFINHKNNFSLDYQKGGWGYAVFGKVVSGMDVVDKIAKVKTKTVDHHENVPEDAVVIEKIEIKEAPGPGLIDKIKDKLRKFFRDNM